MKSGDIISALIRALFEVNNQGSLAKETAIKLFAIIIASVGDEVTSLVTSDVRQVDKPSIINDVARINIDGATKMMATQKYFYKVKSGCGKLYRSLKNAKKYHNQYCKSKGSGCSLETTMRTNGQYPYRSDIQGWLKNKDEPSPLGVNYTVVEIGLK